jgi:hypothetical protein
VQKYFGFEDLPDILHQFQSDCDNLKEEEVLFASYGGGCYDGFAIVLFQRDGKLYTSEGSHCSCYGLEGQWEMIETTKEILSKREFYYHPEFIEWLKEFNDEKT